MTVAIKDHPYLTKIGPIFYFRRKVPLHLVAMLDGQKEMKKSLETSDRREANRLIHDVAAKAQRRLDEAEEKCGLRLPSKVIQKSADSLRFEQLEASAREWYQDRLSRLPSPVELANPFEDRTEALRTAEMELSDILEYPQEFWSGLHVEAGKILEHLGVVIEWQDPTPTGSRIPRHTVAPPTPVWKTHGRKPHMLVELLYRAKVELARQGIARLRGDFSARTQDELFSHPMQSNAAKTIAAPGQSAFSNHENKDDRPLTFNKEAWKDFIQQKMKPRQVSQYVADLDELAAVIKTVSDFEPSSLQNFLETRLKSLSPNTIVRKFSVYRNYWSYLKAHQLVPSGGEPFKDLLLPKKKVETRRSGWLPDEVCRLWHEAKNRDQKALADAIRIAAFTGSRIEAICSLSTKDVTKTRDEFFVRFSDKTLAGQREVPIHSAIKALIERLTREASSRDGFLIESNSRNRHGERSTGIGKQFHRLKVDLGYGRAYVFHSLRNTVVQILEDKGCPDHVTGDIVGHNNKSFSYVTYGKGVSIATKRKWIKKIAYPDADFMKSQ